MRAPSWSAALRAEPHARRSSYIYSPLRVGPHPAFYMLDSLQRRIAILEDLVLTLPPSGSWVGPCGHGVSADLNMEILSKIQKLNPTLLLTG